VVKSIVTVAGLIKYVYGIGEREEDEKTERARNRDRRAMSEHGDGVWVA